MVFDDFAVRVKNSKRVRVANQTDFEVDDTLWEDETNRIVPQSIRIGESTRLESRRTRS